MSETNLSRPADTAPRFVQCCHYRPAFGPSVVVDFDKHPGGLAWLRVTGEGIAASVQMGADEAAAMGAALLRASRQLRELQAVAHQLETRAAKADARRFTGEPITGFGAL